GLSREPAHPARRRKPDHDRGLRRRPYALSPPRFPPRPERRRRGDVRKGAEVLAPRLGAGLGLRWRSQVCPPAGSARMPILAQGTKGPSMSIRSAILSSLLLMAAASLAFAEEQPTTTTTPPPEEPQWTEFQSPERGFAVSFPGTPKV